MKFLLFIKTPTPLGDMLLEADNSGLCGAWFCGQKHCPPSVDGLAPSPQNDILQKAALELADYFAQKLRVFTVPVSLDGTPFQMRVWKELLKIPYGETVSYGDIAHALKLGGLGARAVGGAVGRNPVSVIVPCHRVIGKDGSLTGYGGGIDKKKSLLGLEGLNL
ncbi:methylated-DNA--protein-cysteine methyltransferase [Synergistales bacterium]|nr:methylated-DNA--protein-cysteine methyltransferase [Synergistales bacterium]